MQGGVGRYTSNLVHALSNKAEVVVVCNKSNVNNEDNVYSLISTGDYDNSNAILKLMKDIRPDIVHIQYENALYERGTTLSGIVKNRISYSPKTTLDKFYLTSSVPTVTTLHTVYPYDEYIAYVRERIHEKEGRFRFLPVRFRAPIRRWVFDKGYNLFTHITKFSNEIINLARATHDIVGRGRVIYHGGEPIPSDASREELREEFGLPRDKMLLLAFGYADSSKGLEILSKVELPHDWVIVTKQTKHYRSLDKTVNVQNGINLDLGYMNEYSMSKLFFACDAIVLPYEIVAISGVMFDALAHGLPFVASNLTFFREFAEQGLGVVSHREPKSLSNAINLLSSDYEKFRRNVENFRPELRWDMVASKHMEVYLELIDDDRESHKHDPIIKEK